MTKSLGYFGLIAVGILMGLTAFGIYYTASANPSRVQQPVTCSTQGTAADTVLATTSVTYLSLTATSTITCNMATAGDGTQVWDSAMLNIQLTASSTGTLLCRRVSYSYDGVDYYPLQRTLTASTATSSRESITWAEDCFSFASSTNSDFGGSLTLMKTSAEVPVLNRFVKVEFYRFPGTWQGAVWANLVGKVERVN